MNYRFDVRPQVIDRQVHGDLGGALSAAFEFAPLHVHDDQVLGVHHALADAGGRTQHPVLIQADGDVAVVGGHPALLPDEAPDLDDILPQIALRFDHWNN